MAGLRRWRRLRALFPGRPSSAIALTAMALAVVVGCGEARPRSSASIGQTGSVVLSPRVFPAQAWTGERLFVFGGNVPRGISTPFNDGALIDPQTGHTEPLAAAPFDPPLGYPKAIAAAGRVLVIGHSCAIPPDFDPEISELPCEPGTYAAATYDVAKGTWHSVEIPPEHREITIAGPSHSALQALGTTTDGRAVLMLGDFRSPQYWTIELETGKWSRLPDPGVWANDACVSNDELFVLTTKYKNGDTLLERDPTLTPVPGQVYTGYPGDGHVLPSLAILDLRDPAPWRQTPVDEGVNLGESSPYLSCLDHAAAVLDAIFGPRNMRLYTDATATWSIPAPPPLARFFSLTRIWTGSQLILLPTEADAGSPAVAYVVADDCWRVLEGVPPVTRGAIWSGSAIVGYAEPLASVAGPPFEAGPYHFVPPNAPCAQTGSPDSAVPPAPVAQAVNATPLFTA
jgi:hypothetical protein